mmetsp:Transcript_70340/g.199596  ORF Transcript_70340/g.199596 Transcript_70340/m.199596 type:complete len:257 (+) Transcript_70340:302-1072(+)
MHQNQRCGEERGGGCASHRSHAVLRGPPARAEAGRCQDEEGAQSGPGGRQVERGPGRLPRAGDVSVRQGAPGAAARDVPADGVRGALGGGAVPRRGGRGQVRRQPRGRHGAREAPGQARAVGGARGHPAARVGDEAGPQTRQGSRLVAEELRGRLRHSPWPRRRQAADREIRPVVSGGHDEGVEAQRDLPLQVGGRGERHAAPQEAEAGRAAQHVAHDPLGRRRREQRGPLALGRARLHARQYRGRVGARQVRYPH